VILVVMVDLTHVGELSEASRNLLDGWVRLFRQPALGVMSCRLTRATVYVMHALLETLAGDGWAPADTDARGGLTGAAPHRFQDQLLPATQFSSIPASMIDDLSEVQAISGPVLS
jgi:hypothetical protein